MLGFNLKCLSGYFFAEKILNHFNHDPNIIGWILDILSGRPQSVDTPLSFTMYTNDCGSQQRNRHLLKYAIVDLSVLSGKETG